MALITKPFTFASGATIIASEHNDNFDTLYNDYNGNITNANIAAGAGIVDTKLAQITTPDKVSTAAITDDDIDLAEITADGLILDESAAISTGANQGAIYTKAVSGLSALFFRTESDGAETQLTGAGSATGD